MDINFVWILFFVNILSLSYVWCDDDVESTPGKYESRIAGGHVVTAEQYPYNVRIYPSRCGGTIVAPLYIITAWRCHAPELTVLPGVNAIKKKYSGTHKVVRSWRHSKTGWYGTENYHIMIAKLDKTLHYSSVVKQIPIGREKYINHDYFGVVVGYGHTEYSMEADLLRAVTVRVTPHKECLMKHRSYWEVMSDNPDLDFCAGSGDNNDTLGGKHTHCPGDFGAGLVVNGTLIGVAIETRGCGEGHPGIYTSVPFASSWIYDQLGDAVEFPEEVIEQFI